MQDMTNPLSKHALDDKYYKRQKKKAEKRKKDRKKNNNNDDNDSDNDEMEGSFAQAVKNKHTHVTNAENRIICLANVH